ncbi:MAG TPA: DUF1552 domain-containing protein [Polyangiaceae bacterium]|nr:DUF1552 domain-containing protein [Polyangiaceae bacterium]
MFRRQFLAGLGAGLGAAGLGLPWLGPTALAQAARPKRLITFFTPHGAPAEFFWPTDASALTSSHVLEPLAAFQSKLNVIRGIDYIGSNNHVAIKDVLTNQSGKSLDNVVADHLAAQAPVRALHLGVVPDYSHSFTVDGQLSFDPSPVAHEADPVKAFDELFGATTSPSDPAANQAAQLQATLRQRVVGFTTDEVAALADRLVDLPSEAQKLQTHFDALTQIGAVAPTAPSVDCGAVSLPSVEALRARNADPWAHENFPDLMDAQIDIAAAAVRCGVTRVISLQMMHVNSQLSFAFAGVPRGHHDASHSSPGSTGRMDHANCQRFMAEKLARLLTALEVPDPEDPEHTVLDNSAVLWCSEIGDGQEHTCIAVPTVIAGSAGGALKTGQLVQLTGRSHSAVLLSLANAMGLSLTEFGPNSAGSLQEIEV